MIGCREFYKLANHAIPSQTLLFMENLSPSKHMRDDVCECVRHIKIWIRVGGNFCIFIDFHFALYFNFQK